MANGLPIVLIMMVFMYVFANIKAAIPALNPIAWDTYFADLDRPCISARQPWEWLQPLLGYAPITFLLNVNYNLWFLVTWMVWVYFAFPRQAKRTPHPVFPEFLRHVDCSSAACWRLAFHRRARAFTAGWGLRLILMPIS